MPNKLKEEIINLRKILPKELKNYDHCIETIDLTLEILTEIIKGNDAFKEDLLEYSEDLKQELEELILKHKNKSSSS